MNHAKFHIKRRIGQRLPVITRGGRSVLSGWLAGDMTIYGNGKIQGFPHAKAQLLKLNLALPSCHKNN